MILNLHRMGYIIIKTIITAIVIVLISEIAKKSSLFAGLIASLPLTSFLAFIWLHVETKDTSKTIDLSYSIILMIIPSFIFFIVLPMCLKMQIPYIFSMILAFCSTALSYWLYVLLLNKFGINF